MSKHHHHEDEAIEEVEETAEWLCEGVERDNERMAEEAAEFEALLEGRGASKHRPHKEHADRGRASRRETR